MHYTPSKKIDLLDLPNTALTVVFSYVEREVLSALPKEWMEFSNLMYLRSTKKQSKQSGQSPAQNRNTSGQEGTSLGASDARVRSNSIDVPQSLTGTDGGVYAHIATESFGHLLKIGQREDEISDRLTQESSQTLFGDIVVSWSGIISQIANRIFCGGLKTQCAVYLALNGATNSLANFLNNDTNVRKECRADAGMIMWACCFAGNHKGLDLLISDHSPNRAKPNAYGTFILGRACKHGHIECVRKLIHDQRMDCRVKPRMCSSKVLRDACFVGIPEVVQELLADPSPEHAVVPDASNGAALSEASACGHTDIMSILLQDGRVLPSRTGDPANGGFECIRTAILEGQTKAVRLLLHHSDGANFRVDPTTIRVVCLSGNEGMLRCLGDHHLRQLKSPSSNSSALFSDADLEILRRQGCNEGILRIAEGYRDAEKNGRSSLL